MRIALQTEIPCLIDKLQSLAANINAVLLPNAAVLIAANLVQTMKPNMHWVNASCANLVDQPMLQGVVNTTAAC